MSQRMTMRTYKATVRKAHELYVTLEAAGNEYGFGTGQRERVVQALGPMQTSINALRRLTCTRCDERGYDPKPRIPGWNECQHPDVPTYDLRTGEEWSS